MLKQRFNYFGTLYLSNKKILSKKDKFTKYKDQAIKKLEQCN